MDAVRAAMRDRGLAGLVLTSPENIYYLVGLSHQGYFAFTALVLRATGEAWLVARAMEWPTITAQVPTARHVGFGDHEDPAAVLVHVLEKAELGRARLGVERDGMFFPPRVSDALRAGLREVEWVDVSGLLAELRFAKSPAEIACMRRAAAVSDAAMRAGIEAARPGVNEIEVAAEVHRAMLRAGGEYPGFTPLIRSTETLDQEHGTWRDHILEPGETLFIELAGCVLRYHAPLSRMLYLGGAPAGIERAAVVAREAMDAARSALRPGVLTGEVYDAWQAVIDRALGHQRFRRHHCGYVVGIGFPPSWVGGGEVLGIRPRGTILVRLGMSFHLFAWLIGSGLGDYVLSDTAVVTESGAELLTATVRAPIVK